MLNLPKMHKGYPAHEANRVNHMASIDDDSLATDDTAQAASGPVQPEIADLVGIARRGWLFIVSGTMFGIICAFLVISTIPPVYKASSRIVFERTLPRYLQTNKVTNEPLIEDYDTLGQTYVISSESIVLQVVRSLLLASDLDFVGGKNNPGLTHSPLVSKHRTSLGFPERVA